MQVNEIYLLIAVIVVVAVVALLLQRRTVIRQQATITSLQADLRALCNAGVTMGERLHQTERRVKQLTQQQEALGMRQEQINKEEPEARAYAQAIKMAQKGASVDDLMDVCGLSRGEADLVAMMHRLGGEQQ